MNALSKKDIAALREGDVVYVRMVVAARRIRDDSLPDTQRGDVEIALRADFSGTHRWERCERSRAQRDRAASRCPLHSESATVAAQQLNGVMCHRQPSVEPVARSEMDPDQKLADCPLTSPMLRVVAYLPERPDDVHLGARRSPN